MSEHLRWRDLVRSSAVVQIQRAFYPPGYAFPLHDHDFAEVFLILDGPARHLGGGAQRDLPVGSLGCVAPALCHALAASRENSCTILNIAFPDSMLQHLLRDYPELADWWTSIWPPHCVELTNSDRHAVLDWSERLLNPGCHSLELHAFLLDLAARLLRCDRGRMDAHDTSPIWLRELTETVSTPQHFAVGVGIYARLSGRSREHINRLIRRHYGMTTIQLLNRRRMDYAALRLRHGEEAIGDVIAACGFTAPAQFYRHFKERFGLSPAAYRNGRPRTPI